MEVDQIQFELQGPNNGDSDRAKLGQNRNMDSTHHYPVEEEEEEEERGTPDAVDGIGIGRFYGWPSSRIVRVSRASGGKDRHSKVLTSKGLRDRRVRLSVNTAIQFYDLQDRLGYDQPSKAVEWLLKAAESSIKELPPMNPPFPVTPKQMSDEKWSDRSSTSETSKGSSRSDTRSKGRVAGKEKGDEGYCHTSSFGRMNQASSFTELLNGPPMEYFTNGFSAGGGGGGGSEIQHFGFGVENYGGGSGGGEYNLNFSACSVNSAGIFFGCNNRGTLQSNVSSPSPPSFLRFSPGEGSRQNFLMGSAATATAENHDHDHYQQFLPGFESQKGKGKK